MISCPSVGGCLHGGAALTSPGIDGEDPFVDNHEAAADLPEDGQLLRAYNRMADTYGLNPLQFGDDPEEFSLSMDLDHQAGERRSWFARAFGKPPVPMSRRSSRHSAKSDRSGKNKQNDGDPSGLGQDSSGNSRTPKDTLRSASLKTLVRICGKSLLYLPNEYATRSLTLPTCIRATAQYLAQNGPETRGVFRISGATRVVIELYDYYCSNIDEADIAATVRSPNLPFHIKYSVHDVATVFKRILAGLPGGILGQLPLFDALVEIYTKCSGASHEFTVADVHHVRARLIALAVGAVPCPLQRELICAVFGLLCRIGRAAEAAEAEAAANEEAESGLSGNSEMMGYGSLGIIFGPLLLGDLLALSASESADGAQASVALPAALMATTSPRPKAERRRKSTASDKRPPLAAALTLDKVLLANNIAEMLIKHWTEVVDQMRKLATMRKMSFMQQPPCDAQDGSPKTLRSSRSETFTDLDQDLKTTPQPLRMRRPRLRKTRSAYITQDGADSVGAAGEQRQLPPPASHRRSADETRALRGRYPSMERESPDKASTFMKQVVAAFSPIEEKLYELSPGLVSPPHFSGRPPRSRDGDASPWRLSMEAASTEERNVDDSSPSKAAALLARIRNSHRPGATPTASPTKRPEKRSQMLTDRDIPAAMSVSTGCREPVPESGRKRLRKTARAGSGEARDAQEQTDTVLVNPKRRWRGRTFSQMVDGMKGNTDTIEENRPITPKRGKQQDKSLETTMTDATELPRETSWEMELPVPLSEIKNESRSPQKANARAMRTPGGKSKAEAAAAAAAAAAAEGPGNKSTAGTVKAMAAMFDNGIRSPPAAAPATTREPPKTPTRLSHYTTNHSPPKTEPPGKVSPGSRPARVSDGGSPEAMRDTADEKTRRLRQCRSDERIRRLGEIMTRSNAGGRGTPREKKPAPAAAAGTPKAKTTATTATTTDALVSSVPLTAHTAELSHPPGQHAAYSLLLAQLRNLQQQLEAKTAECQSWRRRAETAEMAMAELEGYTELLHNRYGNVRADTEANGDGNGNGEADNDNGYASDGSNMTVVVHGEMVDETD